jgi:hypothetical protein
MSVAELPIPSTSTLRFTKRSSGSRYQCEWSCSPVNDSWPGKGGSGYLGSQWWPFATITAP